MRWINVVHFYQPPLSSSELVMEAAKYSYQRIARSLLARPQARLTVNFTGSLLEQLLELGQKELIADWQKLVSRGQVELLGTAYWHALLPKISLTEVGRQVLAQEQILKQLFDIDCPIGFFAPELAYSSELLQWLKDRGYRYVVADEAHVQNTVKQDKELFYQDQRSAMILAVRQRQWSRQYPPEVIEGCLDCPQNLFTVTDGELYGLRHLDQRGNWEKCLDDPTIEQVTVAQALPEQVTSFTNLIPASWESTSEELKRGQPYFVWDDRRNSIHQQLWLLAQLAQQAVEQFFDDDNYQWMLEHLHSGLASCHWWWASNYDFDLFGGRAWNPDQVIRGAEQLVKSIRSINNQSSLAIKLQAEKILSSLQAKIWKKHWQQWSNS